LGHWIAPKGRDPPVVVVVVDGENGVLDDDWQGRRPTLKPCEQAGLVPPPDTQPGVGANGTGGQGLPVPVDWGWVFV
jgi:hypothetical protein